MVICEHRFKQRETHPVCCGRRGAARPDVEDLRSPGQVGRFAEGGAAAADNRRRLLRRSGRFSHAYDAFTHAPTPIARASLPHDGARPRRVIGDQGGGYARAGRPHVTAIDPGFAAALAGQYRLERVVGEGGMATVFLASDLKHQRQVAVKVLRPELGATLGKERFLREITTTANLRHPRILPLFDSGEAAGLLYYVMPFIEGESLRDRLTRGGALATDEAMRIADEVADALGYAHSRGVIHRDIKPENILLENGHAVVADFGIAHAVTAAGDDKLTMMGMALGTPHYMSPEQGSGEAVDARTDIYALGCVTYEMLDGMPPFTAATPMGVLVRHAIDPVPSLALSHPELDDTIVAAIERALAKAPNDRYATIAEWRAAISVRSAPRVGTGGTAMRAVRIDKLPPAPSTPLLGRDALLDGAAERLRGGTRVLSVIGYGGTGKTRFSIELLRRLGPEYTGGGAFVSLAAVTSATAVLPTIATALDIAEAHGRSALDALCTVIGDRRVLLVLDNLEQVLDAASDIASMVGRCPALQVIATSRAPLKIGAESEFSLPPLDLPAEGATLEAIRACPSVMLFQQRAEKVKLGFALTSENAPFITAICRKLDGLPLALELAAARVRVIDPASLLQRLDHALDLLTSGDRDLPLRQRTLRATISWSYSLLQPMEQRLLRRTSVFHDGWTLEAMEQVCYDDADRHRALDELDSLVEKGLVRVLGGGERYALLETIRAFAAEQLHASGEVDGMRQAHAAWFLTFASAVNFDIRGSAQVPAVVRAREDNANLHAAIAWLTARARAGDATALEQGLSLVGHLNWFWHIGAQQLTARAAVDALLALAEHATGSGRGGWARLTLAMICTVTGEWERCFTEAHAALTAGRKSGDHELMAEASMYIGYHQLHEGQAVESRAALDESIALSVEGDYAFVQSLAMSMKGMLLFATGDLPAGRTLVTEAYRTQERLGNHEVGGVCLSFLARMAFAEGDHAAALALYRQSLVSLELVGDRPEIARVHTEVGWTLLVSGAVPAARRAFQLAVTANEEIGSPRGTGLALLGLAAVEAAAGERERAVTIAAAAQELSTRAGVVVDYAMDPGVVERIEALKALIPRAELDALLASGCALTPAAVLAMVAG